jgi:hypothetical protein
MPPPARSQGIGKPAGEISIGHGAGCYDYHPLSPGAFGQIGGEMGKLLTDAAERHLHYLSLQE